MTIYLIRHGKTLANEQHLYCGSTDLPLSDTGKKELAQIHYPIPGDFRFISSGMQRANETLEILFPDRDYEIMPGFREVDFGRFEMKRYDQLKDDASYQDWISGDNEANVPPDGESGLQMTHRAISAFLRVVYEGMDAVIVTHGGIIAALMARLFPKEEKNRYQWQSANGGGYQITIKNGKYTYSAL